MYFYVCVDTCDLGLVGGSGYVHAYMCMEICVYICIYASVCVGYWILWRDQVWAREQILCFYAYVLTLLALALKYGIAYYGAGYI